jgi:prepilin-type N-terminal cleavage/methylation domain-containing protein
MTGTGKRGFSLVELIVVTAVIALLMLLLVPTFVGVREHVRTTECRSNLKQIAEGILSNDKRLPYPAQWRASLVARDIGGVLHCPSDDQIDSEAEADDLPDLSDVYIVQKQGGSVLFSNMQVILDSGTSPEDRQIMRVQSAHGIEAGAGQMLVKIGGECALMRVTYGSTVSFESIIINASHGCGSVHWLCIDDGSPDWRSRIVQGFGSYGPTAEYQPDPSIFVMRLQSGPRYTKQWDPLSISRARKASYGMSNAVSGTDPRPGQLLVVEYAKDVASVTKEGYFVDDLGVSNTDEDGFLRTRHFGMANFVTAGRSVRSMTREQLQWEYDQYTNGIWAP